MRAYMFEILKISAITMVKFKFVRQIRVITKLPNFEQSYKGKVKPHKKKTISQQPENCEIVMTLYRHC